MKNYYYGYACMVLCNVCTISHPQTRKTVPLTLTLVVAELQEVKMRGQVLLHHSPVDPGNNVVAMNSALQHLADGSDEQRMVVERVDAQTVPVQLLPLLSVHIALRDVHGKDVLAHEETAVQGLAVEG